MFATLHAALGTWPSDSTQSANYATSSNAKHSGVVERFEWDAPSAASVFVVTQQHYPDGKVFVPPYFVPPNATIGHPAEKCDHQNGTAASSSIRTLRDRAENPDPPEPLSTSNMATPSEKRRAAPHPTCIEANSQSDLDPFQPPPFASNEVLGGERARCWSLESRNAFHAMINSSRYINRYRLTPAKRRRLKAVLSDPTLEPLNPNGSKDHQTKYQAANWTLRNEELYRVPNADDSSKGHHFRQHLDENEVWDTLTAEHVISGHLGRDKLRKLLEKKYIGYTLQEIMFILRECRQCNGKDSRVTGVGIHNDDEQVCGSQPSQTTESLATNHKQASNFMWF